nr:MAG: alpha-glucosidase [Thermoproteus sp. AZ2]
MEYLLGKKTAKISLGEPPIVQFSMPEGEPKPSVEVAGEYIKAACCGVEASLRISVEGGRTRIWKRLAIDEHVLGLGEKAAPVDRRRSMAVMFNFDAYGHTLHMDPLYVSIPFAIFVQGGKAFGLLVNSPAFAVFDIGIREYDAVVIEVEDRPEIYLIFGPSPMEVLEAYAEITGKPFLPPRWALGYQISRYTYYPQDYVAALVDKIASEVPLDAIYVDIDHMEKYKVFTWDRRRFPDPRGLVAELHEKGVRVVPIVDPYIKAEPGYRLFEEGLRHFLVDKDDNLYLVRGWPGPSALPDFLNGKAREWWARVVEEYVKEYDVDGIWLDMNEPTNMAPFEASEWERIRALAAEGLRPGPLPKPELLRRTAAGAVHRLDDGRRIEHERAHNAYAYFEAMATYEGMAKAGKRPFILSRAGYAGIQKYAAVWTGDVVASWEGLRETLMAVLGLAASGVHIVGADIGGFAGYSDPELVVRWYQASIFFPLFRAHKGKEGNDVEIFALPTRYKEAVVEAIKLRYKFLPYLWHLAWEAHLTGRPIIRPLPLEFPDDEDSYRVNDEYMAGPHILVAPHLRPSSAKRPVYLPRGAWIDYWSGAVHLGPTWVEATADLPIYVRRGSAILGDGFLMIYGEGRWRIYHGEGPDVLEVEASGNAVELKGSVPELDELVLLGAQYGEAEVDGIRRNAVRDSAGVRIELGGSARRVVLRA